MILTADRFDKPTSLGLFQKLGGRKSTDSKKRHAWHSLNMQIPFKKPIFRWCEMWNWFHFRKTEKYHSNSITEMNMKIPMRIWSDTKSSNWNRQKTYLLFFPIESKITEMLTLTRKKNKIWNKNNTPRT